mmetsp:Transcript_6451/g.11501  ORF Transcript_6451/g.11501 Transcript_6451/m.11501 type:complete len:209 (+) Transcript_6451:621-1247(+)
MKELLIFDDATFVVDNGFGVDSSRHGSSRKHLRLNFVHLVHRKEIIGTILGNGCIGKYGNSSTCPSISGKGITGATRVHGRAGRVHMRTESIVRLGGTRRVWHARVIRNKPIFIDKVIRATGRTSMTRSSDLCATIQDKLNGQINFFSLGLSCNLDAIRQRTHGTMGPTGSTVLGNVLVERVCQVRFSVDITPVKGLRKIILSNVGIW